MLANAIEAENQSDQLNQQDRCDVCQAQAYVLVRGVSGELLFCGHDYSKVKDLESMIAFAFEIIDETYKLDENRLMGEN